MDDREYNNIYIIPANYTDSGRLLGGMLETRNAVEAVILVLLVGYPELMWLSVPGVIKVVIMTVTLMPLGVFSLIGIGGDSLMQFVTHMFMHWIRRRKLRFRRINYRYDKARYKTKTHKKKRPKKTGKN